MFFCINASTDLLPQVEPGLYLDEGWHSMEVGHCKLYYKGYTDQGDLAEQVNLIYYGVRPPGIWAVIEAHSDGHVVHTPNYRAYPLYKKGKAFTNIHHPDWEHLSTSVTAEEISPDKITLDVAVDKILEILTENIQNILVHNKLGKPKLVFSGGIDSLSLWAILDNLTTDYTVHANDPNLEMLRHLDYPTAFKLFNKIERVYTSPLIEMISKKYWGYELTGINHTPTAHIVGFWGDEIMLRNPDHIDILAKTKGTTALAIVKPQDYMYDYLTKSKYELSNQFSKNSEAVAHQIIKMWLGNDFQMWHLDKHLHYSPYFDIRIYQIMRQLSIDDILLHGTTAVIQRKIIDKVNPKFNLLLADQKNTEFNFQNYTKNKHQIPHIISKTVT